MPNRTTFVRGARPGRFVNRPCQIHIGGDGHVHQAVCSTCRQPLGAAMEPTCWHPATGAYVGWRCVEA